MLRRARQKLPPMGKMVRVPEPRTHGTKGKLLPGGADPKGWGAEPPPTQEEQMVRLGPASIVPEEVPYPSLSSIRGPSSTMERPSRRK